MQEPRKKRRVEEREAGERGHESPGGPRSASPSLGSPSISLGSPSCPSAQPPANEDTCPICLEPWSAQGAHRLCSLKCGHFFGRSCIEQLFTMKGQKKCPCCAERTRRADIRNHFISNLRVLDAQVRDRLQEEVRSEREKTRLEREERQRVAFQLHNALMQVKKLEAEKRELVKENTFMQRQASPLMSPSPCFEKAVSTPVTGGISFSPVGGTKGLQRARCLAYSDNCAKLLVSCSRADSYGLSLIAPERSSLQASRFLSLHTKPIRDLDSSLLSNLVLTASSDKTLQVTQPTSGNSVYQLRLESVPFACAWSRCDSNVFFASSRSSTLVYDLRKPSSPVRTLEGPFQQPVHTILANEDGSVLLGSAGGCASYHDDWAHPKALFHGGNVGYMGYDERKQMLLATLRSPTAGQNAQHRVLKLEGERATELRTLYGTSPSVVLSRGCVFSIERRPLAAVSEESTHSVNLWSLTKGMCLQTIPLTSTMMDAHYFKDELLAILTHDSLLLTKNSSQH